MLKIQTMCKLAFLAVTCLTWMGAMAETTVPKAVYSSLTRGPVIKAAPAPNIMNGAAMIDDYLAAQVERDRQLQKIQPRAAGSARSINGIPAKPLPEKLAKELQQQNATEAHRQQEQTKRAAAPLATATFTPLCPTLNINVLYTLSGVTTGNAACYHFNVPARSKSQVILTGQNLSTNFLLALFKDDGFNNTTVVDISDNPGNSDEFILALTEPGDYYWYMEANAADGTAFNFGVAVNSQIDQYELNDTLGQATVLADGIHTLTANSDDSFDEDYYQFTSVRGQNVRIRMDGISPASNSNWILEYLNGSTWMPLSAQTIYNVGSLVPQEVVTIRVRPNPSFVPSASAQYRLIFGSTPIRTGASVTPAATNFARIPFGYPWPNPIDKIYLTTQTTQSLFWGMSFTDSSGTPLFGLQPVLKLAKNVFDKNGNGFLEYLGADVDESDFTYYTSNLVNLGTCFGNYEAQFFDSGNAWDTDFNFGLWRIEVPGHDDLGVGGENVPYVTLGHICDQDLIN